MVLRKKREKSVFASPLNNAYGPIGCEYVIGIFQETGLAYFSYKSKIRFNIKMRENCATGPVYFATSCRPSKRSI